jgi:hypothetical protein
LLAAIAGVISSDPEYCDRQIAQAIEESCRPHTEAEHLGILLREMDWRVEREHIFLSLGRY